MDLDCLHTPWLVLFEPLSLLVFFESLSLLALFESLSLLAFFGFPEGGLSLRQEVTPHPEEKQAGLAEVGLAGFAVNH